MSSELPLSTALHLHEVANYSCDPLNGLRLPEGSGYLIRFKGLFTWESLITKQSKFDSCKLSEVSIQQRNCDFSIFSLIRTTTRN